MAKITKRKVDTLKPPAKGQAFIWDDMKGFGVRITSSGVASYIVQYRNRFGKTKRYTVGRHGVLTAEEARNSARKLLGQIAEGIDPAEEKKQAIDAARNAITIHQLSERYIKDYALLHKKPKSVEEDNRNLRLHILPALGRLQVEVVSRLNIVKFHNSMKDTPYQANRCIALLSKMFNLADEWGITAGHNPCKHIKLYREENRERFLSPQELARLAEALDQAEKDDTYLPSVVPAIRLLIYTGARKNEILKLRWEYVDLDRGLLHLPDSKTGRKIIPLNTQALEILAALPRDSEWIFTGKDGRQRLTSPEKSWRSIRKAAGIEDVRLHDLRHTFASIGASANMALPILGKILGHRRTATTQKYAHLADDPVRQASAAIADKIADAMNNGTQRDSDTEQRGE